MGEDFVIPLNGLAAGENIFSWHAGKEFFERFDNSEILDAQFDASAAVEKSGQYIGVDCNVDGHVTVECDRCLENLLIPVHVEIRLSVKYGDGETSDEPADGDREVIFVPSASAELDMSQIIYDYVCLSLPMQRVHLPGGCNPDAVKYIGTRDDSMPDTSDNPFGMLKDLLK
ncbi:MAG: YceD family protein [Bacteroidales bacterium]|nr:YceD family protein [Bacteroidales bacterium]